MRKKVRLTLSHSRVALRTLFISRSRPRFTGSLVMPSTSIGHVDDANVFSFGIVINSAHHLAKTYVYEHTNIPSLLFLRFHPIIFPLYSMLGLGVQCGAFPWFVHLNLAIKCLRAATRMISAGKVVSS
jgi:putative flippase GtrA